MDVRCPNCRTEYELDENRLRPGGVTVKCASCEHVFRVRRRAETQEGIPQTEASVEDDSERSWLVRVQDGEIKVCRELATLHRWIVSGRVSRSCEISRTGKKWKRLGEIAELVSFFDIAEEAREVAAGRKPAPTGPSPVVEGSVIAPNPLRQQSHPHTVPRPTTERAGRRSSAADAIFDGTDTVELTPSEAASPYAATEHDTLEMSPEQARAALAAARASMDATATARAVTAAETTRVSQPPTQASELRPPASSAPPPMDTGNGSAKSAQDPLRATMHSAAPPPPARARTEPSKPPPASRRADTSQPPPLPPGKSTLPRLGGDPSEPLKPLGPKTGDWAAQAPKAAERVPSGPTGGIAKGVPTQDAAFATSKVEAKERTREFSNGRFVATDELGDEFAGIGYRPRPKGGVATWIVLASLLVLVGATAAVYFVVFRGEKKGRQVAEVHEVHIDAAAVPATAIDAAAIATDPPELDLALQESRTALVNGDPAVASRAVDGLAKADAGDLVALVLRSRLHSLLAQHEVDGALVGSGAGAKKHKTAADEHTAQAGKLADQALEKQPDDPETLLAKAEALRLAGASSREVERWLRKAQGTESLVRDAEYVRALLHLRDRRLRDAHRILDTLGDELRIQHRKAVLLFAEGKLDQAQTINDQILAVMSEHAAAKQLADALRAKLAPPTTDDEGDGDSSAVVATNPGDGDGSSSGSGLSIDSYDGLLERADKAAESGNCNQAVKLYERALDANPSGVAALTGLGYCHLDAKRFASAQARFRAALGISSAYQDALWGVAEAYQQQGMSDKAVEAYRKFVQVHPTSRRAEMAKRQIERLGGTLVPTQPSGGSEPPVEPDSEPDPAPPATDPEPASPPAPESDIPEPTP